MRGRAGSRSSNPRPGHSCTTSSCIDRVTSPTRSGTGFIRLPRLRPRRRAQAAQLQTAVRALLPPRQPPPQRAFAGPRLPSDSPGRTSLASIDARRLREEIPRGRRYVGRDPRDRREAWPGSASEKFRMIIMTRRRYLGQISSGVTSTPFRPRSVSDCRGALAGTTCARHRTHGAGSLWGAPHHAPDACTPLKDLRRVANSGCTRASSRRMIRLSE